jgi:methionine-rich copper-binding protein CopC
MRRFRFWTLGKSGRQVPRAQRNRTKSLRFEPLETRQLLAVMTIAQENALAGTPQSVWDIDGAGSDNIEGYAAQMSVDHGQTVQFKVNTDTAKYHLDIYRLGYYGGNGARYITTIHPDSSRAQNQPNARVDGSTGLVDAGNWAVSAHWDVPVDATSGVYIAKLVRDDGVFGENHIVFVVRDDEGHSDLLFKTADSTWQAYNSWGGASLYAGNGPGLDGRAYQVSYNRPFVTRVLAPESWVFGSEYPMIRFLEANGYNVSYTTDVDVAMNGSELLEHKVFLSVGHDEYWSADERTHVEAARDAGVNLAFFSGNEVFWKTRWAASIDGSATPYRTLVCYKETLYGTRMDPSGVWTGTWRDPRFSPPADGGKPENALTGTMFVMNDNGTLGSSIMVPAAYANLRFWRNTSVATLAPGQTATLGQYTLGYEWDGDVDNGFRPAGLFDLSSTTVYNSDALLLDYGGTYGAGSATHSLTLYRAASGALVFGAGTIHWSWGLDGVHDLVSTSPDARMQQATVNLFADMGAQPATLRPGLVRATQSTDFTAPTSTITSPLQGAKVAAGQSITITGTAQDAGGGVLAVVEVSVDGGLTWRRANGLANWSYTWTPRTSGTVTIKSRAVDDSGNIETPSAGVTINPPADGGTTFSLWNNATVPSIVDSGDGQAVELGMKFKSDADGYVTGVRFYKSAGNTGTHVANLWSATGALLASATFTSETASGWQQVNFATPVAIKAGTVYVVSYHTNSGHYSVDRNYFATAGVDSGSLHALANGVSGTNGVYLYGAGGFPTNSYQSSNYWVDVVLNTAPASDTTPPAVTAVAPANNATSVAVNSAVTLTFSEALAAASVTSGSVLLQDSNGAQVAATVAYNSNNKTVTLTPASALAYSATYTVVVKASSVGVTDLAGNALAADFRASFTTAAAPAPDTTPPTVVAVAPANNATNVAVTTAITITVSETLSAASVTANTVLLRDSTGAQVAASVSYNAANNTVTLTPTGALANSKSYTVVVKGGSSGVKDLAGNALTADFSSSFTTAAAVTTFSLWTNSITPSVVDSGDGQAVELGMKFKSDADGYITGVRFYKSAGNTGTHVANLWSSTGAQLASATFTSETANGWQQVNFATPVAIKAGTVYVVSYHTSSGHYSVNRSYFATSGADSGPLHGLANGASGTNGLYLYGAGGFPTNSYQSSNYWVDVVLSTAAVADTTPPVVKSVSPAAAATGVATNSAISVTFSEAMTAASVTSGTVFLRDPAGAQVAATLTYNASTNTATLTPSAALANSATYTVVVKGGAAGVKDLAGNALAADFSSSFTTAAAVVASNFYSLWNNSTTPAVVDSGDGQAVELGMKFKSDVNGSILGVRFYKSAGNTGTHVANLWSSTGKLLATATFTAETASGWQQVNFATPVAIRANTVYVVSYHTNSGHYAVNRGYFATSGADAGPLHGLANGASGVNGVYLYGAGGFPTKSYQASNYWVDVVMSTDVTPPTVTGTNPANNATGVSTTSAITIQFSEALSAASVNTTTVLLRDSNGVQVGATVTYNPSTNSVILTPTAPLSSKKKYQVLVKGGASGVKDLSGNSLSQNFTSVFTTL